MINARKRLIVCTIKSVMEKLNHHWSLRMLADKMVELKYTDSISHEAVRQVLKKTKSNPGGSKVG
jgi:uncharacterized protein involved in propanediol utilization